MRCVRFSMRGSAGAWTDGMARNVGKDVSSPRVQGTDLRDMERNNLSALVLVLASRSFTPLFTCDHTSDEAMFLAGVSNQP